MKTAVVTGGAGFVGSHLVDLLLSEGHKVRVLDNFIGGRISNLEQHFENPNYSLYELDITNIEIDHPVFTNANWIFHLAGIGDIVPSIERPLDYFNVNCLGTARIAEAARLAKIERVIYAASSSCYGLANVPTNENDLIDPQYPYALSKFLGEQVLFHWNQVYGLPVISIRIFNAYGTRSRTSGAYGAVLGVFLKQRIAGKPLTIVGDGMQSRDFVYVSDVAKAFLNAATLGRTGEVYNLGFGQPRRIIDLAKMIADDFTYIPKRPGEPDCTWADISKIKNQLKWEPSIDLETGVQKLLNELEFWKDAPLWDAESIEEATALWFKHLQVDSTDDSN